MTHKTKGILLRTIKYGETSLVVSIFTELFGVQTYLVNGVRTPKRSGNKAAMYQPAAILDLEVYHNDLKGLQRIKDCNWDFLYENILNTVVKNSIALYMVELLQKVLRQPEEQTDLFNFCEDALLELDKAPNAVTANFALYFTLQLPQFFGFKINNNYSEKYHYLDLQEGNFTAEHPTHMGFLEGYYAGITSELLRMMQPAELGQLKLNKEIRRGLLLKYQEYYRFHISDFGQLRSLEILHEVLG
ncbi:MAG: DNA repair protein RecO [Ferruginibacter sp.]|nr:DNA repair protein RecO [Ferruginibacter sp.]